MKKEITLKVIINPDDDSFGMNLDTKGFDERTPLQNSLLIASILEIAHSQELSKFPLRSGN